jgi:hypothetical protein
MREHSFVYGSGRLLPRRVCGGRGSLLDQKEQRRAVVVVRVRAVSKGRRRRLGRGASRGDGLRSAPMDPASSHEPSAGGLARPVDGRLHGSRQPASPRASARQEGRRVRDLESSCRDMERPHLGFVPMEPAGAPRVAASRPSGSWIRARLHRSSHNHGRPRGVSRRVCLRGSALRRQCRRTSALRDQAASRRYGRARPARGAIRRRQTDRDAPVEPRTRADLLAGYETRGASRARGSLRSQSSAGACGTRLSALAAPRRRIRPTTGGPHAVCGPSSSGTSIPGPQETRSFPASACCEAGALCLNASGVGR